MFTKVLSRGDTGEEVVKLQLILSGFRGTVWDGDFGPGTELQVMSFQRDFMKIINPNGIVGNKTKKSIEEFLTGFKIDFSKLICPCGRCGGFGRRHYKGEYRNGKPKIEANHKYEYPGIHKSILYTLKSAMFYANLLEYPEMIISSGYRCHLRNSQKGRSSTNHMGKAIDIDFILKEGEDKIDDKNRSDRFRSVLVEKSNFQIGWNNVFNKKSLEPSNIAPTWIHMDVRCFSFKYLKDEFFVKSDEELF